MQIEHQPAIRIDYNLGSNHRLTGTFNKLWQDRNPDQLNDFDQRFPDAPNFHHTVARRPTRSITLRSTLSNTLVNEFRVGITVGERMFFGQPASSGPQTFADTGGYSIDLDGSLGLTNWHTSGTLSSRSAYQYTFDDTLTWQKGRHSVTFGGRRVPRPRVGRLPAAGAGNQSRVRREQRSRGGHVRRKRTSRAHRRTAHRRARSVRAADRASGDRHGRGRPRRGDQHVLVPRQAPARRHAEQLFGVRAGLVADDADADAERRPAMGRADAVLAASTTRCRRRAWPTSAASRGSGRRHLLRLQLLHARSERRQGAGVLAVHERHERLQHRLEQRRAERRRRVAAERAERDGSARSSAIPSRPRSAAAIRSRTSARASRAFTGVFGPIPAARCR